MNNIIFHNSTICWEDKHFPTHTEEAMVDDLAKACAIQLIINFVKEKNRHCVIYIMK